ncbi:MAG: YggS family pyridoxal phosphate-dependent enzyme [Bacilli bacterium]|nr:YggS family pyridoxal phosphate-dependent enzyme [Bacilli bacterium]
MIRKDIDLFIKTIPQNITLVAATKYVDVEDLKELKNHGIVNFGENRVDSFLNKYKKLKDDKDIIWHFIGHLQRNKAKLVYDKIDFLHSLDSLELAKELDKLRKTPLNVFVEVSINLEENKNGVPYYELENFLTKLKEFKNINLVGLMMMSKKESNDKENQFAKLKILRDEIEQKLNIKIPYLSMGMSDDYLDAIREKATHIRLGRILFNL